MLLRWNFLGVFFLASLCAADPPLSQDAWENLRQVAMKASNNDEKLVRVVFDSVLAFADLQIKRSHGQSSPHPFGRLATKMDANLAEINSFKKDQKALDVIACLTEAPDPHVRIAACVVLRHLEAKSHARHIVKLLNDPSNEVRQSAVTELILLGEKSVSSDIVPFLSKPETAGMAARVLQDLCDPSIADQVALLLDNENRDVNDHVLDVLQILKNPSVIPRLEKLVAHKDELFRDRVIRCLCAIDKKRGAALMVSLLDHEMESMRSMAASQLGEMGDPSHASHVAKLLNDKSNYCRRSALSALEKIHDPSLAPQVSPLIRDVDTTVRQQAIYFLAKCGPKHIPQLMEALEDRDVAVRWCALYNLSKIGDKTCIARLARFLGDPNPQFQISTAKAIGKLAGESWEADQGAVEAARAWWAEHKDDPEYAPKKPGAEE